MTRTISVGIDIGTYHVKVVVGEQGVQKGKRFKRILGTGSSESKGLRYGYIVNTVDVARSVQKAVYEAEKKSHVRIRRALVSIGGVSVESAHATGTAVVARADAEITDLDVNRALAAAKQSLPQSLLLNNKVLHTIPLSYKLDGRDVLGDPIGMRGTKLEVQVHFITCLEQHQEDLIRAVEEVGVEVEDVVASPLAAAVVNLSKPQKVAGVILANIGAETVSLIVFENDMPLSVKVFPIGSTDITNDIALGLKIPLHKAHEMKHRLTTGGASDQKKLEDIVYARLSDIFELIESHLKSIGKNGMLPAGIVMTGGGSGIASIEDLARATLKLPSERAKATVMNTPNRTIENAEWSVAYGLCLIGLSSTHRVAHEYSIKKQANHFVAQMREWMKQLLP